MHCILLVLAIILCVYDTQCRGQLTVAGDPSLLSVPAVVSEYRTALTVKECALIPSTLHVIQEVVQGGRWPVV